MDPITFPARKSEPKDLFELVRKEDIDELMSIFPRKKTPLCCKMDGCSLLMRDGIDAMDDERHFTYLKYHFATCERVIYWALQAMQLIYSEKNAQ